MVAMVMPPMILSRFGIRKPALTPTRPASRAGRSRCPRREGSTRSTDPTRDRAGGSPQQISSRNLTPAIILRRVEVVAAAEGKGFEPSTGFPAPDFETKPRAKAGNLLASAALAITIGIAASSCWSDRDREDAWLAGRRLSVTR